MADITPGCDIMLKGYLLNFENFDPFHKSIANIPL